ncbi:MAG: ATP-binding protein [Candidatus Thiodiazotropha taylori]|nr:ATP-binding protein [Candidatus Thiodiazotropha taylori]
MINYLVNHIKLRYRIYAGYLFTGTLALVIVLISYIGFSRTIDDFSRFVFLGSQSRDELQLISTLREIQRQALIYTHEGHLGAALQVEQLSRSLQEAHSKHLHTEDSVVRSIHKLINNHLEVYSSTFKQVTRQRQRQLQLINVEFRSQATAVEELMQILLSNQTLNVSTQLELQNILSTLLLVEKNAFRYFDSLDSKYIQIAKHSIHDVQTRLILLHEQMKDSYYTEIFNRINQALLLYETSFLEAVQRTRGYLYLINVVMAAEAYEILYQAEKLSSYLDHQMEMTEDNILLSSSRSVGIMLATGLLLILLIMVISYIIGQSVAIPLLRLKETFNTLSEGASKATIPRYTLTDELGDLTHSAEAFRHKNQQTEELLQQSIELTSALEQSKKDLERSNDELEQFVYTVSHDLKSPLVTSMGFIGIIKKFAENGQYQQAIEKLDKVVVSNQRMGQLINDLLELSRVGRVDLDMALIDLNELLGKFAKTQQERLQKLGFNLAIQEDLPVIYANESRTLQLFENILSNAVKYVKNESIPPSLEIGSVPSNDGRLIYCRDNGPGIPQEYHEKIFGLFYRLGSIEEGTGIGLAVAKKVMKFHNGLIWVESEPNQGAVFWLKFPNPPVEV